MALDQTSNSSSGPTDRSAQASDNRVDNPTSTAREGALSKMQADSVPQAGQDSQAGGGAAAKGANQSSQPGDSSGAKDSAQSHLPKVEFYDSQKPEGKGPEAKGSDAKVEGKPDAKQDGKQEPISEVSRSGDFDSKKPTAAFVDDFKNKDTQIAPGTKVSHGDVSMQAAKANGYNTIGLQTNGDNGNNLNNGANDYSKQLNAVSDQIDSGKLPLGKGDVVNVSEGNKDMTFKEASQFTGMDINAQNVGEQKGKILDKMGEISKDPSRSPEDRETAGRIVRTNEAVDRLQSKGVEVVHAAGNQGADHVDLDMMNAKTQLSSNKPDGTPDSFSASNSLTKPGDGVVPTKIDKGVNVTDPTPIKNQTGTVDVGNSGTKFPVEGSGALAGNTSNFDRNNPEANHPNQIVTSDSHATSAELSGKQTMPADSAAAKSAAQPSPTLGETAPMAADHFSGKSNGKYGYEMTSSMKADSMSPPPANKIGGREGVAGQVEGTSFSNIGYLKQNYDRLAKEKAGQH